MKCLSANSKSVIGFGDQHRPSSIFGRDRNRSIRLSHLKLDFDFSTPNNFNCMTQIIWIINMAHVPPLRAIQCRYQNFLKVYGLFSYKTRSRQVYVPHKLKTSVVFADLYMDFWEVPIHSNQNTRSFEIGLERFYVPYKLVLACIPHYLNHVGRFSRHLST